MRGCFKPGTEIEGEKVFHFTSTWLPEDERSLAECPIGKVLRETPHVYDAINAHAYVETGAVNPLESPQWLRETTRIVASERARMHEMRMEEERSRRDSKAGLAALKNRKGGARGRR